MDVSGTMERPPGPPLLLRIRKPGLREGNTKGRYEPSPGKARASADLCCCRTGGGRGTGKEMRRRAGHRGPCALSPGIWAVGGGRLKGFSREKWCPWEGADKSERTLASEREQDWRQGDGRGGSGTDPEDGRHLRETVQAAFLRTRSRGTDGDAGPLGARREPGTTPERLAGTPECLVVLLIKRENGERRAGLEKITSPVLDGLGIILSTF